MCFLELYIVSTGHDLILLFDAFGHLMGCVAYLVNVHSFCLVLMAIILITT